jgi:PAS domain S-box-containing protein
MNNSSQKLSARPYRIVAVGMVLFLSFWLADSGIDAYFEQTHLFHELIHPDLHEIAIRGLALFLLGIFIIYIFHILAKRRALEEALEQAVVSADTERARSEAILAAMGDAVSIQDTELRILYQNQAHKDLMGVHEGDFCYAAYQGREQACDGCHLLMSFQDGMTHRRETSSMSQERPLHVEIISSPLRNQTGKIIAGIEAVRDITDRKLLENQLKQQMAAIEASMDGIAILNEGGEYFYLNQAHATIYGYDSPDELLGKSWRSLYHDSEIAWFEQEVLPIMAATGRWRGESTGRKRDNSRFPQELTLNVLDNGLMICIVRDISDRREAEDEIRRLNRNLTERASDLVRMVGDQEAFNYSLSHDLRTPLTKVYVSAQTLEEGHATRLSDEGRFLVHTIIEACERMEELIEAMLILGRISRSELHIEEVDLSDLACTVSAEIQLADSGHTAEFKIHEGLTAKGDPMLLRIALDNLLGNAWKYSHKNEKAAIEFGVASQEGETTYFVRDNGAGFDMGQVDRLFKPFQRLHRASEFPGTGIGLATVQRIIDRHGGRIWAESKVGEGATFFFTIGNCQT